MKLVADHSAPEKATEKPRFQYAFDWAFLRLGTQGNLFEGVGSKSCSCRQKCDQGKKYW